MRNGKALLTRTAFAAVCTFCLLVWGAVPGSAAELQATDSGAPSAKVMFPVTGKANPTAASMKPVVFNHLIHEKAVASCETCHHTGDKKACTVCHTLEGAEAGGNVTLYAAMHATNIAKPAKGNTPASCVSCHDAQLSKRECAGCHNVVTPSRDEKWCGVCHNVTVTPDQAVQGMTGKLSTQENIVIANKAVTEAKPAAQAPTNGPLRVKIDALANEYQPSAFNHDRHVRSVADGIKDSKLAAAFHSQPETLCATCHHHSPMSLTPPKCSSCHKATIDPANPGRPALKAAYHLQCMGCHNGMNVHRPVNTNCTGCHKAK